MPAILPAGVEAEMTVILQHSRGAELNRVEYRGPISLAEMHALGDYQVKHPDWRTYDFFNLITPGTDFDAVSPQALEEFVEIFHVLFDPMELLIFRRAAWICQSPRAQTLLDHWASQRNVRQGQTQDVRVFTDFGEAAVWLALPPSKGAMLETGKGFKQVALYNMPAGV